MLAPLWLWLLSGCHPASEGSKNAPHSLGPGFADLTLHTKPPFDLIIPDAAHMQELSEPEWTFGVLGDLDGDGNVEVVMSPSFHKLGRGPAVYRFDPRGQSLAPAPDVTLPSQSAILGAVDLDGDGVIDLLQGAAAGEVAWGLGRGKFGAGSPLASNFTMQSPGLSSNLLAAALDDLDGDGWLDVVLAANCCTSMPGYADLHFYLRTGPRDFVHRTDLAQGEVPVGLNAVMVADFENGRKLLSTIGGSAAHPDAPMFFKQAGADADGYPLFAAFDPIPGDARVNGDSKLPSLSAGIPMGAAVSDLDGDGLLDFAVTLDPTMNVFQGRSDWPFADGNQNSDAYRMPSTGNYPLIPWGTAFVDIDLDGRQDLVVVHGNDQQAWYSAAKHVGPQWTSVHWNGGKFTFTDITAQTGLDRRGQWRALTVGDIDGDGDPDLVVGGDGEMARVYKNDVESGNHGFALRLHGTSSNHLGVGARVDVPAQGAVPAQHLYAGGIASPGGLSEPLVFVALGPATSAATLRITWPSGTVQEVKGLTAGKLHTVEEPPVLLVDPPSRHLPAGGQATATLAITPRNPDGTMRGGAKVDASVVAGVKASVTVMPAMGGGFAVKVESPAQKGSSVLEVRVDGKALGVRPRLFWD